MQSLQVEGARVWLLDSVTQGGPEQTGAVVVTGSHGGLSAARYAAAYRPALVVFNDAGVGKNAAGVAGLAWLERARVAAVAVSAASARIGEAADTWASGVISHVNAPAAALGFRVGERLQRAVERYLAG
ncbi:hypothetical protein [Oceanithermus desulfurans]|uniref:Uncharacterized protein n=2 Tax=Oceanithermus desulfurans TaxID=227924 RepID=A0A511RGK7_9DEIN|nr:hypothetical protein [Oceanithermus desulfurans]MBB6030221.1 hypothetical protein [Oceanithermus desulfurans]GEM88779.1 hypothetical protein ODE01S_02130 [Oceanithermus desulfurans NBRC 100063]